MLNGENMPLFSAQHSPNFFQKLIINPLKKYLTPKSLAIAITSGVSTITYYDPSIKAGASVAEWLKYPAVLGGVGTNFTFNLQSYNELLQQCPALLKMPFQLSLAIFFSIACVAPNLFMNIVDEKENYIDGPNMTLQIVSAFLNIGVNIVGSIELINIFSFLLKNKTDVKKEKIIEEINLAIEHFAQSNSQLNPQSDPNEPLNVQLRTDLISQFKPNNDLSFWQKITPYSPNMVIGLFSIPQFSAYLLISYFGMRNLSEKKLGATSSISLSLGLLAAIGNGIPGAGFSIKGVNSISKKLRSLKKLESWEKPSLLATFFVLLALFSGFTTHKAMADSLKELEYSDNIADALKWIANLGAALIYNLPQMLALANSLNAPAVSNQLNELKKNLVDQVKNLDSSNIQNFKTELPNIVSSFFRDYTEETSLWNYHSPHPHINSSRV